MHRAVLPLVVLGFTLPALAQEQGEWTSAFARIRGGAVFDYREGVDGAGVRENYMLTHVVCTDGSRSLRVMLPLGPEDDGITFTMDGEASSLKKTGKDYAVVIRVGKKRLTKTLELKPVNDRASHYQSQFVMRLDYGDVLWRALTAEPAGQAVMLIGTGGTAISIPADDKLSKALASCGLRG